MEVNEGMQIRKESVSQNSC